jgi:hypothetical protein
MSSNEGDYIPSLDDPCGANFVYRDLIYCGETLATSDINNLPQSPDSYLALKLLAENILDPVIHRFGSLELTYGFCSANLRKLITKGVAHNLDQHSAHEINRNGNFVCKRLGASVDFILNDMDMFEVAKWVYFETRFDRLYFYGSSRPIHVSYGPGNMKEAYELTISHRGNRIPRRLHL